MFLIEQYSAGKKVILIVDEAQNLSSKVLEEIRLLSGIETSTEKVLRIILAGQPELKDTLDADRLKQLVQRVRLRFHLGALKSVEMREYVEHRLKVAGCEEADLFEDSCFPVLYRYSGGVPRLINTICDSALLVGYADEKTRITGAEIEATAIELGWEEHEDTTGSHHVLPQLVPVDRSREYVTRIEVRSEGKIVAEYEFEEGRVIVGRSPDNEIYIDSKYISRHHAQFVTDDSGCKIEDLNSTNGIFIEDTAVKNRTLMDGDIVTAGIHELIYHDLRDIEEDADEDDSVIQEA